jgi:hypothetical protein
VDDLYAIRGAGAGTENHLEGRFLSFADDDAARALSVLEAGDFSKMQPRLRSAWSRFVMSLLHRNPEAVAKWVSKAAQVSAEADAKFKARQMSGERRQADGTVEIQGLKSPEYYAATTAVMLLQQMMDQPDLGNHLNQMTWVVVRLEDNHSLLTSDRPLVGTNGWHAKARFKNRTCFLGGSVPFGFRRGESDSSALKAAGVECVVRRVASVWRTCPASPCWFSKEKRNSRTGRKSSAIGRKS